ncbi:MAG: sulfotransferase [Gammaproteobacteria bacterium]|nr:sulfotransferase [Gammaproteobacteria bacterium]
MNNDFQGDKAERRRLAYIMGPNYSGSTLLTLLLADHLDIATVGELKATSMGDIASYNCSCGELLTNCSFWNEVKQLLLKQGRHFTFNDFKTHFRDKKNPFTDRLLRAALRGPIFETIRDVGFMLFPAARRKRQDIIEQNKVLIEIFCTLQQAKIFLDDSKEPIRLKFLLSAELWDIRAIHLIRDGRGVTNSYMRHNKASMTKAAQEWTHTQQECNRMSKILGSRRCLTVHYEELCQEPSKTLTIIYQFLGLRPELSTSSNRTKHIMGNQMRLGSLQNIRLDEKWKQTLTPEDLQTFTATAGELNHIHGYR